MTKTFLLAATALTALVATSAQAQAVLSLSNVDGTANSGIEAPLKIANELTIPGSGIDTLLELALTPTTSAVLPLGNALLTVSLGSDTFGTTVTAASVLQTPGNCNPTRSVVSGGGAGQSSVQFLLSNMSGCDNANPIELEIPVEINDKNTVSVSTVFTTEAGTPIDGGSASVASAITFASGFLVTVDDDGVLGAVADVNAVPVYSNLQITSGSFTQDLILGDVDLDIDTTVNKDFWQLGDVTQALVPVAVGDITDVTITVTTPTGSFAGLTGTIDGVNADFALGIDDSAGGTDNFDGGDVTVSAGFTDPDSFVIAIADGSGTIEGATVSVSAALNLTSIFTDETATGLIDPITLGGTNFVAPWLAINNPNNSSTVRISNHGSVTGPVILTLLSPSSGSSDTCDSTDLSKLANVPANGRIEIDVADLRTCFGTSVANGDVRFTIQAAPDQLTAKARLRSSTGTVVETSLGRLLETDESY
ncbi:hypothetical protein [Brevundimonas sp.]|uniref:hypothetical protein n=1 Tax=Brevundimonas sp. TaxID=1871086 RepID=UPI002625E789|nr:hypothetical protein [Brevundimonas sp.]